MQKANIESYTNSEKKSFKLQKKLQHSEKW